MKLWLKKLLETYFPAVKHLTMADQVEAEKWANWMKDQWAKRGLVNLSQQRIPMTETRNAIKQEFGEDHIALVTMNFTEQQWRTMNNPIIDRVQLRNEQVQIIQDPEAIVVKALELLASTYWYDLAAGLVAVTGRRWGMSRRLCQCGNLTLVTSHQTQSQTDSRLLSNLG